MAWQYVKHQATESRPSDGIYDVGDHEYADSAGQPSPIGMIVAQPRSGYVPLQSVISGQTSYDPDGTIADYTSDFGDMLLGSSSTALHT